eukprot:CAMPEP_0113569972 /NCGR_PEP_ID=MMETSP0015_2-20120614/24705_1 /TAXON_ID=2838 /ORGANISM="Odontella" /LENGTH=239 /DNA_ID=CAMNT_0000472691 /DNA_START=119 /DNA_END=835 /DNA_ORIENTATION=- /assembly_acc=CAM_ASM_000160
MTPLPPSVRPSLFGNRLRSSTLGTAHVPHTMISGSAEGPSPIDRPLPSRGFRRPSASSTSPLPSRWAPGRRRRTVPTDPGAGRSRLLGAVQLYLQTTSPFRRVPVVPKSERPPLGNNAHSLPARLHEALQSVKHPSARLAGVTLRLEGPPHDDGAHVVLPRDDVDAIGYFAVARGGVPQLDGIEAAHFEAVSGGLWVAGYADPNRGFGDIEGHDGPPAPVQHGRELGGSHEGPAEGTHR